MKQKNRQLINGLPRRILLMLLDCGLIVFCYYLAILLRFDGEDSIVPAAVLRAEVIRAMAPMLPYVLVIYMVVFWFGGLYEIMWEYAGMRDLARLTCLSGLATGFILLFDLIFRTRPISGTVLILGAVFNTAAVAGVRFLWRFVRTATRLRKDNRAKQKSNAAPRDATPLLIVGAGNAGAWAVNLCKSKNSSFGNPVVIVDDDLTKKGLRVQGVPVRGTISDIPELVRKYHIVEIIIAITTLKGERLNEVINLCNSTHCRVRMLSDQQAVDANGKPVVAGLRELNTSDFLSRDEVQLNSAQISEYLHDKVVLVTGGGGSIGSELCRQLCRVAPARIVIFDIYENDAYMLRNELLSEYDDIEIVIEIGSVCDESRVAEVFAKYRPGAVFHAAAHKHVPLMEACPREALHNNVFGTLNVVKAADAFGAARFIFISTDKAVNPTSVMGATKRMGEMVMQLYARTSKTVFSAVRFGNVLGSNGSVIPVFQRQIAAGGPVTVTHPEIERFFMTIPEASRLVIQAGGMAHGGEIFILDMGEPVKIVELAKGLIQLQGLVPDVDVKITFTGLRDGEKMYEELLMDEESTLPTDNKSIMISTGQEISYDEVAAKLGELEAAIGKSDEEAVHILESAVPTYHHTKNCA